MKMETLVSTMHRKDLSFLSEMRAKNALVINQCDKNEIVPGIISTSERGLSRSRNMAIENAEGDICLIADDDMIYHSDYEQKVVAAYKKHPDADIICFMLEDRSDSSRKAGRIGYLSSMRVRSCEISFRRESIIKNNLRFNALFGAGSLYACGEENIFLFRCLDKGLKIYYVPEEIGKLSGDRPSTWFRGFNKDFLISKGAMFQEMSRLLSLILIFQFAVRKRKLFDMGFFQILSAMLEGRKELKNITRKR